MRIVKMMIGTLLLKHTGAATTVWEGLMVQIDVPSHDKAGIQDKSQTESATCDGRVGDRLNFAIA